MVIDGPLVESRATAESLLLAGDLLDGGVLIVDEHLVVRGWNRWMAVATGRPATEVIGRPLTEIFPDLVGSSSEQAFRRCLAGETVVRAHRFHEYLLPIAPGAGFDEYAHMQQSARLAPLTSEGAVTGAIALIEDVTERVAREGQLRAAIDAAQSASRAKSEFIASMSHELRTPLGAIIGYADILEAEITGPLTSAQKQHLGRVKVGAWHLMGIIEEILTFSRAEAGKEEVHIARARPADVVDDALALVRPQAAGKGLDLRVTLGMLPEVMETDIGKLRQVLVNLLGNAVKFTDAGAVGIEAFAEGGMVHFLIRDTGPGIAAESISHIFEPFTQVDRSLTRERGGTGLGLAVSQRLVELLNGTISVESAIGTGSMFRVAVPIMQPLPAAGQSG